MKKSTAVVISVIVAILVIAGCVWAYMHFTQKENVLPSPSGDVKQSGESIENKDGGEKVTNEPIFTKENYPRIDASTAIQPLTEAIKEDFVGEDAAEIETEYLDTHYGVLGVVDGTRDVCFMSYPSEEELAYAKEKNVELEIVKATNSAFVFIVNVDNPVNSLTLDQIRGIYSGKITNWKEVGGEDAQIVLVSREEGSGTRDGFQDILGFESADLSKDAQICDGSGAVKSTIEGNKNAIGYISFGYVKDDIKSVKIDGVEANDDNVVNGTYAISRPFLVVNKKDNLSEEAKSFVDFILSEEGQNIVSEEGFIKATIK